MKTLRIGAVAAVMLIIIAGCKPPGKNSSAPPVSTPPAKLKTENDLTSIVLTPEAEHRLGVQIASIEKKNVARQRILGGELILPLGHAGNHSNGAQSIYSLLPTMTATELVRVAEMQVTADGQIRTAQVELEAAKTALTRAENLVANKAGTQRAVDEARAQASLAEAALATARERRALLGAPLFDAVNRNTLWVRVPVYAGDLDQIDRSASATVSELGGGTNRPSHIATRITIPFSGGSLSATVDLFYELDKSTDTLRAGQKVSVALPLQGEQESLTAPAAAILYDIHGGTWVYENTASHTFTRRRVSVRQVQDGVAQLARGPSAGSKVVTAGAAELFGTEFGPGK
jgi:hypothetical protein